MINARELTLMWREDMPFRGWYVISFTPGKAIEDGQFVKFKEVTPGSERELEELREKIKDLEKECFNLSAGTCVHPEELSVEEGRDHVFCALNDEVQELRRDREMLEFMIVNKFRVFSMGKMFGVDDGWGNLVTTIAFNSPREAIAATMKESKE